jgi:hypothetical protein
MKDMIKSTYVTAAKISQTYIPSEEMILAENIRTEDGIYEKN